MKTISFDTVVASLVKAHCDLAYSQAGFNIHDCSDSMHQVDEHNANINTLLALMQGQCSEDDLATMDSAYAKGYATYAHEHDIFSKTPSTKKNESKKLTSVSSNTDVDFNDAEGWNLFFDAYTEVVKAEKTK